jgi:hypothetical protein
MKMQKAMRSTIGLIVTIGLLGLAAAPPLKAEEGGTGHYVPGGLATLVDLPPAQPGWIVQPIFLHYEGEASRSRTFPVAGLVTGGLEAKIDALALGAIYTLEPKVLGAYYSVAAYVPYQWMEVSAPLSTARRSRSRTDRASGIGDITLIPAMMAWKSGSWQYSALVPVYAPTGRYEVGELANLGLNYWTFDPSAGVTYSNEETGFSFSVLSGITINTENEDTKYRSGSVLHVEASAQQHFKLGDGLLGIGANGFVYEQITDDSGAGALLGGFRGRTAGVGPVVSYIRPLGATTLMLEARWLPELTSKRRLEGDYFWFKAALDF